MAHCFNPEGSVEAVPHFFPRFLHSSNGKKSHETMCIVCDSIAEPCYWQRARWLEDYFARWEEVKCGMCDDEFASFVTDLGLTSPGTKDCGQQAGDSLCVFEATQAVAV